MSYKIAVLGPIPRDFITTYQKETITRYGAITHTVIALANLLQKAGEIIPVTHIMKKDVAAVSEIFSPYPNVNLSHITSKNDRGDVIQLTFIDQNNRLEKQLGFMDPILPEDVKDLLDCDMFVILAVTDFEVPMATLKYIKENSKAVIVFDAHGPTCGVTTKAERIFQPWVDIDTWLPYIDVLKMNMEEFRSCWYKKEYELDEILGEHDNSLPDRDTAEHCLSRGVQSVYVTSDDNGCYAFYLDKDGVMQQELVPAMPVSHVVDTTGCGDSFAGGLAFGYLKTGDPIRACYYANICGALRTQGKEFDVFEKLADVESIIKKVYVEKSK